MHQNPSDDPRFGSYERYPTLAGILRPNSQEIADDLAKAEEAEKKEAFRILNDTLAAQPDSSTASVRHNIPISILRDSIESIDPGRVHGGKVMVDDHRNVTIKDVEVSDPKNPGAKTTFNIIISNLDYYGIKAFAQRASTAFSEGFDTKKFEDGLGDINIRVLDQIDKEISEGNSSWQAENVRISLDGKISVLFDKRI